MNVRIVLVEPQEGGNVGAVARTMKNFGFRDLVVVGPKPDDPDEKSLWWAAGAEDLVRSIRYIGKLEDALADANLSVATTAVRERHVHEQLTPDAVARIASETLGDTDTLALVFGRETRGLTAREIAMCQRTASIATSSEYATMNLAQAVCVFCYELGKVAALGPRASGLGSPAPGELIAALNAHTRELLEEIGFFGDKSPDRRCAELTAIAGKRVLTTREASLLLSIVRRLYGALKRDAPPTA